MARPWRLRHKLVFGLALVVASVALLLGAAVFGLSSYFDAGRVTRQKLVELDMVQLLRQSADELGDAPPASINDEVRQVEAHAAQTRVLLDKYAETVAQSEISSSAVHDNGLIPAMRLSLKSLQDSINTEALKVTDARKGRLIDQPGPAAAYRRLRRDIATHHALLLDDIRASNRRAELDHRKSIALAGSAAGVAVVLVLTLVYYFRVWVFAPIRQLQLGVRRVHRGEFGEPINLPARDELGELGAEFDAMAARMQGVYRDLAGQVNSRTRQLVRSERLVSVGFLAAGVAHEINNPLASIAFCAEALESRLRDGAGRSGSDAEVVEKYLKMMQDEAQRCKLITQKLLDFSRSGGKRGPADLSAAVAEVLEVAKMLPNARNKRVLYASPGALVAPVSVPDIKGVVLNLTVNALDSMDDGGTLSVSLAATADAAELTFADTGCGMTPDTLETIFEPFFTRNRTGNGTGLGLSISHQIVDQHGGSITAASDGPGRGSTFTVRLPLRMSGWTSGPTPCYSPRTGVRREAADLEHDATTPRTTPPRRPKLWPAPPPARDSGCCSSMTSAPSKS